MSQIRREALDIPGRPWGEAISDEDQRSRDVAMQHIPQVAAEAELRKITTPEALLIVFPHADQFPALLRALLEHRTLEENQVRAIWESPADRAA